MNIFLPNPHFDSRRLLVMVLGCATLLLASGQAKAQKYTLDWWDADAGGISTGGSYTLSGTIGQPEAGTLSGGPFTLNGGFWGVSPSLIRSLPPAITIKMTSTNTIVLAWPSSSLGFVLQNVDDLAAATWTNANLKPIDDGNMLSVVLPPELGLRFYRLKK